MKLVQKMMVLALMGFTLASYADLKLGVVNIQTVFEQVPQGQDTVKSLQDALAPEMNQLKTEQTSLNKEMATFNRNAPTLSAKDRQAQEQKLSLKQQKFQQAVDQLKSKEATDQQSAAAAFQSDLVTAINQVAKSGSYDMIMTDQTVPYYNAGFDVSDQVVKIMNAMPAAALSS